MGFVERSAQGERIETRTHQGGSMVGGIVKNGHEVDLTVVLGMRVDDSVYSERHSAYAISL